MNRQRDKGNCRAGGANDDFQCLWASARIGEDGLKESRGGGRTPASVVQAFIWIVMRGEGARQDQGFSLRQIEENNPEPRSASWDLWLVAFHAYHLRQITQKIQETSCSTCRNFSTTDY